MPKTIMNEKLDFNQALEALEKGLKVKLPEWIGYWFKKDGKILVHSRTGDTLETPFLDDYKNRTDWEVTDGSRDFGGAIVALKAGKLVARKGWNGKGMFIVKQIPAVIGVEIIPRMTSLPQSVKDVFIERDQPISYESQMLIINSLGRADSWVPSSSDVLAEDWEIIE